jgi:hypothetical protein
MSLDTVTTHGFFLGGKVGIVKDLLVTTVIGINGSTFPLAVGHIRRIAHFVSRSSSAENIKCCQRVQSRD